MVELAGATLSNLITIDKKLKMDQIWVSGRQGVLLVAGKYSDNITGTENNDARLSRRFVKVLAIYSRI